MTTATSSEIESAIRAGNRAFMTAFRRGDTAGVAALYTSTGSVLPPGGQTVTGRAAIQAFWQEALDMGVAEAVLETSEVDAAGGAAYEVGTYTLKTADGTTADHGKYLVIWKREGDSWMLHRDIWNTSVTP